MPGPILTLRFGEIGLRLAGVDKRDRVEEAGFVHAEWSNSSCDGPGAKLEPRISSLTWRPLTLAAAAIMVALAGTTWLWAHVGTALFFETIRTGFVACFG